MQEFWLRAVMHIHKMRSVQLATSPFRRRSRIETLSTARRSYSVQTVQPATHTAHCTPSFWTRYRHPHICQQGMVCFLSRSDNSGEARELSYPQSWNEQSSTVQLALCCPHDTHCRHGNCQDRQICYHALAARTVSCDAS